MSGALRQGPPGSSADACVMTALRSGPRALIAATLLVLALLTIRAMQWVYNHRLISYKATHYFFRVSKVLKLRADRLIARNN